jgi:predicted ferric reductase
MAITGRSSDNPHPDARYPDSPYPGRQRYPAGPGQPESGQPQSPQRPQWPQREAHDGSPQGGPAGTPPRQDAAAAPLRDTGAWPPARGLTVGAPPATGPRAPWEAAAGPAGTGPRTAPAEWARTTDGLRAAGLRATTEQRAAGGPRSTGGQAQADGGTVSSAEATRISPAVRASGGMRAVRQIAPGTGRARVVAPVAVLALIGLGLLGVLFLWWHSTEFIHSPGAILIDIGEILGLLAGYGFVVLVALMARLPPLERSIGTDRLARWHATGGRYTISTVTGHVVFIILGYSLTAHASVTSETATLLTTFPDVLMAAVAWLVLLGVAAFSMRAARRRLSYETWYYAHLYTYLAIALAFSHQFANGGTFAGSLSARIAWSALYVVVGGLLLWYRLITPLWNSARYQFTVQSVRPEAAGIVSVFISGRNFDRLRAEPGQFFRWRFLTRELWWQSHPYSLSAMPQPDLMRITVKASGDHSGSLATLKPGTRIIAEGPYGAFTPSVTGRRVLFIAGGVGITPIRAMFAALPKRMSGGITLVYRASHPRDVVFSRELDAIGRDRQAALHYLIGSRVELGYDPLGARELQQTVPGLHRYEAYVCGPSGMTKTAVESLVAAGIPRRRIHHENFDF